MDGNERGKNRLKLCLVVAGTWVMQQSPKNQFAHRETIKLLRSEMTDWETKRVAEGWCVCAIV